MPRRLVDLSGLTEEQLEVLRPHVRHRLGAAALVDVDDAELVALESRLPERSIRGIAELPATGALPPRDSEDWAAAVFLQAARRQQEPTFRARQSGPEATFHWARAPSVTDP